MSKDGCKSVDDLTSEQFEELRQMMVVDVESREDFTVPENWYDEMGDFTDSAVKEFYKGNYFVDDDFCCTYNLESEVVARRWLWKLTGKSTESDIPLECRYFVHSPPSGNG